MQLACITVKAADENIVDQYTYKKYLIADDLEEPVYIVLLSDLPFNYKTYTNRELIDYNTGAYTKISGSYLYTLSEEYSSKQSGLILVYNSSGIWETRIPLYDVTNNSYEAIFYRNYANQSATKPAGFPDVEFGLTREEAETQINNTLNSTTNISVYANQIQNNVSNSYTSYQNGNITAAELQEILDTATAELEEYSSDPNATISDKLTVQNALTQTMIVQDAVQGDTVNDFLQEIKDNQEVTSTARDRIITEYQRVRNFYNDFTNGLVTQSQAINACRVSISNLEYWVTIADTQADIDAYNAAINASNGVINSISNYKELDPSVSDKSQQSDQEELDYLEDITAETTDNIDSLKSKVDSSISQTQANEVKEQVITPLLQNTLIVKVLPIAALFMVLAVTLGFKYKL